MTLEFSNQLEPSSVVNVVCDSVSQNQVQSQVAKKKKKKSKREDNDSGVEAYFREEEEEEREEEKGAEPNAAPVSHPMFLQCDGAWRLGRGRSSIVQRWKMKLSLLLSAGGAKFRGSNQAAGRNRLLLGRRPQLPETCLGSAGRRLQ